jgi:tetratricopeptide (TPR) repeat protein
MTGHDRDICSEEELLAATALLKEDEGNGRIQIERLIDVHPDDARLYFLRGSLHAADRNYELAISELARALNLAPDYGIARFQLGLLHLTSGEPGPAELVWQPLLSLDPGDPLRSFAEGLYALIRDQFENAIQLLEQGIALNQDNPPLNHDMKLMIDEIRGRMAGSADEEEASSVTHLLLQQATIRPTRH